MISDEYQIIRPVFETMSGSIYVIDTRTGYFRRGINENDYVLLGSISQNLYERSLDILEEAVSQVPGSRPTTSQSRGFVDLATEQLHYIFNVSKEGFTHGFEPGNYAIGLACTPESVLSVGPNWIVFNRNYIHAMYDERGITPALPIITTMIDRVIYQPSAEERKIRFKV